MPILAEKEGFYYRRLWHFVQLKNGALKCFGALCPLVPQVIINWRTYFRKAPANCAYSRNVVLLRVSPEPQCLCNVVCHNLVAARVEMKLVDIHQFFHLIE